MKTTINILKAILSISLVFIVGVLFASGIHAEGIVIAALAAGIATGDTLTEEWLKSQNATILDDTIVQKITEMFPGQMPLTTIMRKVRQKKKAESFTVKYYSVDARPDSDTTSVTYTDGVTGGADGNLSYGITVSDVNMWNVHDTVLAQDITNSDGIEVVFLITAINRSDNKITLQPTNADNASSGAHSGKQVVPTMASGTTLIRLAPAKSELDAQTTPYSDVPTDEYNYMQIYMAQVEQSLFSKLHKQRVKWDFKDLERRNMYDMMNKMELSWLFGPRARIYDLEAQNYKYMTGGLNLFAGRTVEYGYGSSDTTISPAMLINWCKNVFADNNGSDFRLVFGGKNLTESLQNVGLVTDSDNSLTPVREKSLSVRPVDQWDMRFSRIDTNFGTLLYRYHKGLDRAGWSNKGVIIDINNVDYYQFLPMAVAELELDKSGQRLVTAHRIMEASGPIWRYPKTHALIDVAS